MLRLIFAPIFIAALALNATCAGAQEFPNHPIRFLQDFAPGGTADTITRILSTEMEKTLGWRKSRVGRHSKSSARWIYPCSLDDGSRHLSSDLQIS